MPATSPAACAAMLLPLPSALATRACRRLGSHRLDDATRQAAGAVLCGCFDANAIHGGGNGGVSDECARHSKLAGLPDGSQSPRGFISTLTGLSVPPGWVFGPESAWHARIVGADLEAGRFPMAHQVASNGAVGEMPSTSRPSIRQQPMNAVAQRSSLTLALMTGWKGGVSPHQCLRRSSAAGMA